MPQPHDTATSLSSPVTFTRLVRARLWRWAGLMGVLGLTACASDDFMRQYQDIGRTTLPALPTPRATAEPGTCRDVTRMTARDLYGEWRLSLLKPNVGGHMRLSQHPEFSESLRGHIAYGDVQAIASGDVTAGQFDLDESADGKRMTATWSGKLTPAACGNEIRGTWTDLERDQSSAFVLRRVGGAAAAADAASTPVRDELPDGVQVLPVPEPSLN
ncbi:hypothetical protein CCO03_04600 [Comamonas serinivorans]|uniref:Uncharacterized protein n=1 Tax=Comamonas serinivorans TaxID=1082851 RepID=A0A1Y0EL02_9BURK|nr:hypothetical protein [Comamonas serinivorans]ARU04049.1 hypothetical protein CCO03_04600 [Comamonas serinivorans]